jgi:hypothetical protein
MAKAIQFKAGEIKFAATLTKIDRDKVYGFIELKVSDEKGNPCSLGNLLEDGSTIALNGATAMKTVDESNKELDKKSLKVVYQDGKDAVLVPSSYDQEVVLKAASLDDLFNLEITAVYQLGFEDENQKNTTLDYFSDGKVVRFQFNYRQDYEGADAILIANPTGIFALTGSLINFSYLENNQVFQVAEIEEELEEEGELDFGML